MSDSSGRTGAPWAMRGLVVASVLLPLLVLAGGGWLTWRTTVQEANAGLLSRACRLRGTGGARARHACPAGRQGQRSAGRSQRRCGDGARARTARSADGHDRRPRPGDRDRGHGGGRPRAGGDLALSRGSRRQLQRPRVFHRPARQRRAIRDRRRRIRSVDAGRCVHRRDSPRPRPSGISPAPSWSACLPATSANSTASCLPATPTTAPTCCARTQRRSPAIRSRRRHRAASVTRCWSRRSPARRAPGWCAAARRSTVASASSPIAGWQIIRSLSPSAAAGVR